MFENGHKNLLGHILRFLTVPKDSVHNIEHTVLIDSYELAERVFIAPSQIANEFSIT